jgi:hypothetical protein
VRTPSSAPPGTSMTATSPDALALRMYFPMGWGLLDEASGR